jgi:hypothetical protein
VREADAHRGLETGVPLRGLRQRVDRLASRGDRTRPPVAEERPEALAAAEQDAGVVDEGLELGGDLREMGFALVEEPIDGFLDQID